jgi:phosphatidylinositol glycan class A protein
MRKSYRIAMVCDFFYPRLGGVENHIWSLSQELVKMGHKVIVITHAYGSRRGVRYMSGPLKVYYCPITPMVDQDALPSFTATFPLLRSILIREGIEIIHAHQATSTMANESIVYAGILGIASVYTDHSLFGLNDIAGIVLNRVLQTTMCAVDAAICVSHACRDNFVLRANVGAERVRVIPNAVDASMFQPDPSLKCQPRLNIVVVSRLVYRKGVDLLVGIIPKICRRLDSVDFIIGGDGPKMLDLQEMVELERLHDRVTFLGSIPHARVRDVLVQGHIFLNCSLTESFCIAILEAASTGLLVVSTNVGGVPEVLPDDMILLADSNVPSIVQRLVEAVDRFNNGNVADSWSAHQRVTDMYSWQRVAVETEQVYSDVCLQSKRLFCDRISRFCSIGGISGLVVVVLLVIVELWTCAANWYEPSVNIDIVPDVIEGKTKKKTCSKTEEPPERMS